MAPAPEHPRVGLVLGAGGILGGAWLVGALVCALVAGDASVSRLGGDEFAVVGRVATPREAVELGHTLRSRIEAPGSIRGDFATLIGENIVHGSDAPESAARELALFFGK